MSRLVFLAMLLLAVTTAAQAGEFKVIRVYDGDTFKAQGHDVEVVVRLMAIDAPETPASEDSGAGGINPKKAWVIFQPTC